MACGPPRPNGRGSWKVKTRGCGGLWPTCRTPSRSCGSGRGKLVSPTRRLRAVTQAMGRSCIRPRPTCRNSRLSPPGFGWRGEPTSGWPLRLPAVAMTRHYLAILLAAGVAWRIPGPTVCSPPSPRGCPTAHRSPAHPGADKGPPRVHLARPRRPG